MMVGQICKVVKAWVVVQCAGWCEWGVAMCCGVVFGACGMEGVKVMVVGWGEGVEVGGRLFGPTGGREGGCLCVCCSVSLGLESLVGRSQ